jgi:uncharacterized spore protein YtfJ
MNVVKVLEQARDAMTVRQVYGDPIERNGTTVIPVASVQGAGGGGEDESTEDKTAFGGGWGVRARPVGAYVMHGDEISWRPAVDLNRIIVGGQIVAVVALLTVRTWLRRRR